jgi:hypothetical protein
MDKEKTLININFHNLCMEGDLKKIDKYVQNYSDKLSFSDKEYDLNPLFFNLAKINSLEVIKYLFSNPYIKDVPNFDFWNIDDYVFDSALDVLYENNHKDFIKYLLTNKELKDNVKFSRKYVTKKPISGTESGAFSSLLLMALKKEDWNFLEFLFHSSDIKYPVEKDISILKYMLYHMQYNDNIDYRFMKPLLKMCTDFFEDPLISFLGITSDNTCFNLESEMQRKTIMSALDLNLIDSKKILNEIDNRTKDSKWFTASTNTMNAYKILLHHEMQERLITEHKPNKKVKI